MEDIKRVSEGTVTADLSCFYTKFDKKHIARKQAVHKASVLVSGDDEDGVVSISDRESGIMLSVRYDEMITLILDAMKSKFEGMPEEGEK